MILAVEKFAFHFIYFVFCPWCRVLTDFRGEKSCQRLKNSRRLVIVKFELRLESVFPRMCTVIHITCLSFFHFSRPLFRVSTPYFMIFPVFFNNGLIVIKGVTFTTVQLYTQFLMDEFSKMSEQLFHPSSSAP